MKNKAFIYLISSAVVIVICSLLRWFLTGSIEVDNNTIHTWHMYPIVFSFIVANVVATVTLLNVVLRKPGYNLTLQQTFTLAGILALIMVFLAPMLSSDTATYFVIGDLGLQGKSVYVNPSHNMDSSFAEYLSPYWYDCPNHYGPPLSFLFVIAVWIGKSYVGAHLVLKLILLVFAYIYFTQVRSIYSGRTETKYNVAALLMLTPSYWLQGVGHWHVDAIIAVFIVILLLSLGNKKWWLSGILLGLIVASKTMYGAVFIPFVLFYMFMQAKPNYLQLIKNYAVTFSIVAVVAVAFYAYWWEGLATITTALDYHEGKSPSRSFVEMISDIIYYIKIFTDSTGTVAAMDRAEVLRPIWDVMRTISKYFGLLLAVWVALQLLFVKNMKEVITIFGKILVVAILFYSPNFHPWYCMIFIPFFMYTDSKSWLTFLVIIAGVSNLHEITYTVPDDSAIFWLVAPLVFIMLITFLLYFKKHWILEPYNSLKNNKLDLKEFFTTAVAEE